MAFGTLYEKNCAGCHGADGRLGASRPLNDPVYLALVPRERLREVIARGIPGTAQPALGASAGGTLTDAQIDALVRGLIDTWGRPDAVKGVELPPYAAPAAGDAERGRGVFNTACATCHGADGRGGPKGGSVVDASYLALVSDQYLRTHRHRRPHRSRHAGLARLREGTAVDRAADRRRRELAHIRATGRARAARAGNVAVRRGASMALEPCVDAEDEDHVR